jgi:hypothetical protein
MNPSTTTTTTTTESLIVAAKLRGEDNPILLSLLHLYNQGIRLVTVGFSGGGDSGDVQDVHYYRDGSGDEVSGPKQVWNSEKQQVDLVPGEVDEPEHFTDQLYELIQSHVDHDWVNNEGGGGTIDIDLNTLEVDIQSYWNETVQRDADPVTLNLVPVDDE